MAQRRMLSLKIINSARFIKMPMSSQLLYIYLSLNADDDGVVEAYNVMRMMGFNEDDLKVLVAKEFVVVLNEDLVSFIRDWREHNLLRADRKIDTMYKDLLLQMVPDAKLLEAKKRADLKKKNNNGRPDDVQRTPGGPHRLGEDRLGKVKLGKIKKEEDKKKNPLPPSKQIKDFYEKNGFGLLVQTVNDEINSFLDDDNLEYDLIIAAMKEAVDYNKISWAYVRTILTNCYQRNIHTAEQFIAEKEKRKKRKNNSNKKDLSNYMEDMFND